MPHDLQRDRDENLVPLDEEDDAFAPWLEQVPGRCGGRVTIAGTRIEPRHVHAWMTSGMSLADICDEHPHVEPASFVIADFWWRQNFPTSRG